MWWKWYVAGIANFGQSKKILCKADVLYLAIILQAVGIVRMGNERTVTQIENI